MLMLGRVRVLLLLLVRVVALVLLRRLARLRMRVVHGIGAVVRVRLQPLHSIMLLRSIPASASHRVTERMRLRLLRLLLRLLRCLHRLSELRLCERTCCVVIEAVICSVWLHRLLRLLLVVVRTMLRLGGCLSVGCGCRAVVRRMRCVCVCARWLRWRHVWWRRVVPHVVRCCASAVQCSAAAVCCWLCRSIRWEPPVAPRDAVPCLAAACNATLSHTRLTLPPSLAWAAWCSCTDSPIGRLSSAGTVDRRARRRRCSVVCDRLLTFFLLSSGRRLVHTDAAESDAHP